ncbi:hypothetical protein [Leucobacter sp.]
MIVCPTEARRGCDERCQDDSIVQHIRIPRKKREFSSEVVAIMEEIEAKGGA